MMLSEKKNKTEKIIFHAYKVQKQGRLSHHG